jgi:hypothetical protein
VRVVRPSASPPLALLRVCACVCGSRLALGVVCAFVCPLRVSKFRALVHRPGVKGTVRGQGCAAFG